jgi:hypothetical protein
MQRASVSSRERVWRILGELALEATPIFGTLDDEGWEADDVAQIVSLGARLRVGHVQHEALAAVRRAIDFLEPPTLLAAVRLEDALPLSAACRGELRDGELAAWSLP